MTTIKKSSVGVVTFLFVVLSLGLLPAFGQDKEKAQAIGSQRPLAEILNSDGTLKTGSGVQGSFNPKGFRMLTGVDGKPRFVPVGSELQTTGGPTISAAGDEYWDSQFGNLYTNGAVYALAMSGTNLYVGGAFTDAGSLAAADRIASWNTETGVWSALGIGINNGAVYDIAVSGTDVYVGGAFTDAGGIAQADNIAKWNGSTWSALQSGVNSEVTRFAVSGTDLYVGGWFTQSGDGSQTLNYVAKWNGSNWSPLGAGAQNGVNAVVYGIGISGTAIYVGGMFTQAGGAPANYIARWNGTSWSTLLSGANDGVYWIEMSGADAYVGGAFTLAGGNAANHVARWNGSSWSTLGEGVNDEVDEIAVSGIDIYFGGMFTQAGGNPANRIAKWNAVSNTWSALGEDGSNGANGSVFAIAVSGSDVYVGGQFTQAGGHQANYIAKWDTGTYSWPILGSGLNGPSLALATNGTDIYVGGEFTEAGGRLVNNIAKWNGTDWSDLESGVNGRVRAVAVSGTDIYVGGEFTEAGGHPASHIARWDGSHWVALGNGVDGPVWAITVSGSDVYVGGYFWQAGDISANCIAKWDPDTEAWFALGSGRYGTVFAIAESWNGLYIGGDFLGHFALWDPGSSTWQEFISGPAGDVYAIAVSGFLVYVGGYFSTVGGTSSSNIALYDSGASMWFPLGTGVSGWVNAISVSGADVYVGGAFDRAGSLYVNNVAKWHRDDYEFGTWSSLGSGVNGQLWAMAKNGTHLAVAGEFHRAGDKPSQHFARWILPFSVTSPNGHEIWMQGSLHDITWTGSVSPVKIEFTTDNGSAWTTIVASIENAWSYSWTLPAEPSSLCKVRISDAADGAPLDTSDSNFLIPGFKLIAPNGGEQWVGGSAQTIAWATGGGYTKVNIEYSTNNGGVWQSVCSGITNMGSYTWTVPDDFSSQCLVRVSDSPDGFHYDTSDAVFSIVPYVEPTITVTSPNGGESWVIGSTHDVTWTSAGIVGDVTLVLLKGIMSITLGTAPVSPGLFPWTLDSMLSEGDDYRIQIYQASVGDYSDGYFSLLTAQQFAKDDLLGTWDGQGVYYRDSDTGAWVKLASPATKITVGDLDGDGIDDLIGLWPGQGGIWVRYSQSGAWAKLSSTAQYIAAGDMNGDGRVDLVGTWDGQGVFYRNSITGAWVKMATPATMVTAGDIDNDGTDDLIGLWPSQGGIWVKYSQTGTWAKLSSTAVHIASGDMNGDERDDLLGTWDGQGVYYRDSATGTWIKMASPATLITTGDLDGDEIDNLIGIWPTQGGVWVKYSSDGTWERLSSTAQDIAAGKMRAACGGASGSAEAVAQQTVEELPLPMGGSEEGPAIALSLRDLSDRGPGGARFVYLEDINLEPGEGESARLIRIPGPGESGVKWIEQDNLFPQETPKRGKKASIDQRTGSKK